MLRPPTSGYPGPAPSYRSNPAFTTLLPYDPPPLTLQQRWDAVRMGCTVPMEAIVRRPSVHRYRLELPVNAECSSKAVSAPQPLSRDRVERASRPATASWEGATLRNLMVAQMEEEVPEVPPPPSSWSAAAAQAARSSASSGSLLSMGAPRRRPASGSTLVRVASSGLLRPEEASSAARSRGSLRPASGTRSLRLLPADVDPTEVSSALPSLAYSTYRPLDVWRGASAAATARSGNGLERPHVSGLLRSYSALNTVQPPPPAAQEVKRRSLPSRVALPASLPSADATHSHIEAADAPAASGGGAVVEQTSGQPMGSSGAPTTAQVFGSIRHRRTRAIASASPPSRAALHKPADGSLDERATVQELELNPRPLPCTRASHSRALEPPTRRVASAMLRCAVDAPPPEPGCTEWCPSAATPFNLRLVSQAALDHCRAQD